MGCLFKRKATNEYNVMTIKYNTYESVLGIDYITPCPHEQKGKYTHVIINVGSKACCRCPYHMGKETDYVKCKLNEKDVSVLQKEKEEFFVAQKEWWRR